MLNAIANLELSSADANAIGLALFICLAGLGCLMIGPRHGR